MKFAISSLLEAVRIVPKGTKSYGSDRSCQLYSHVATTSSTVRKSIDTSWFNKCKALDLVRSDRRRHRANSTCRGSERCLVPGTLWWSAPEISHERFCWYADERALVTIRCKTRNQRSSPSSLQLQMKIEDNDCRLIFNSRSVGMVS
jgi:hypothetical protein